MLDLCALRHLNGYLLRGEFRDYQIIGDRIYSPRAGFATAAEIDDMDFIRRSGFKPFYFWLWDSSGVTVYLRGAG